MNPRLLLAPPRIGLLAVLLLLQSRFILADKILEHNPRRLLGDWEEEIKFHQGLQVTDESPIYEKQSKYQNIEVHVSKYYGKILVLDDVIQLTERDADAYNEMMAHIPMMQHANPKKVLVIGGGDGKVLSELLKYDSLEHVDHVDLDMEVVETCKKFFSWGAAWDDPRVTLHVMNGAEFVRNAADASYDVVVQDSSDPWTTTEDNEPVTLPSAVLYEREHFQNVYRILKSDGVFNLQSETFNIPTDLEGIVEWRKQANDIGFTARYGSLYIATYTTGQIGFMLCEKKPEAAASQEEVERRFKEMTERGHHHTTYYHPPLQKSSFDLPLWVQNRIFEEGSDSALSQGEL